MKRKYSIVMCFILIAQTAAIVDITNFFPFGTANGDVYLASGDDTSSSQIPISIDFHFFNYSHSSLWVNVNGAISFVSNITTYTPTCAPVARSFRMISPFWADVDTQNTSPSPSCAISYRETNDTAVLQKAKGEIVHAFPAFNDISLTWSYIVTWYNVTYYKDDPYRAARNSFQAIITTDGIHSFTIFYYNKIQWETGDASGGSSGFGGTPAQIGFDAGDGVNRLMLDVSCTPNVTSVNQMSNVGKPGVFVFRVDLEEIATPSPPPTLPPTPNPDSNAEGTPCSTDTSQAWLDIIFVIDTSSAMTSRDLLELSGEIATFMQTFTFGQNGTHTTRAAIITYSTTVVTRYSLTDVTNNDGFQQAILNLFNYANPDDNGGNVQGALQAAHSMLGTFKSNRVPAIILIAAAYDNSGFQGAYQTSKTIKDDGISILSVSFAAADGVLSEALKNISSPGYYYLSNQDGLYVVLPYALTQINCFCPPSKMLYKRYNPQFHNYTSFADCLYGFDGDTLPSLVKQLCTPGIPASLTSQDKIDFVTDLIVPHDLKGKKNFTVGLHKSGSGSGWYWWGYNNTEYPFGSFPPFYSQPPAGAQYGYMSNYRGFNWGLMAGGNTPRSYLCQSRACDASYICDLTS